MWFMVPVTQDDCVLVVILMHLDGWVDDERRSEAVDVLTADVTVVPVSTVLFVYRNLVGHAGFEDSQPLLEVACGRRTPCLSPGGTPHWLPKGT